MEVLGVSVVFVVVAVVDVSVDVKGRWEVGRRRPRTVLRLRGGGHPADLVGVS